MTFKQMLTVGAEAAAGVFGPQIGGVRARRRWHLHRTSSDSRREPAAAFVRTLSYPQDPLWMRSLTVFSVPEAPFGGRRLRVAGPSIRSGAAAHSTDTGPMRSANCS